MSIVTINRINILLTVLIIAVSTFGFPTVATVGQAGDTYSMSPVIEPDDYVVIDEDYTVSEAEEGDIVVFDHNCAQTAYFQHQVVNKTEDGLITKGINVSTTDQLTESNKTGCVPPVNNSMIQGEVTSIHTSKLDVAVNGIAKNKITSLF